MPDVQVEKQRIEQVGAHPRRLMAMLGPAFVAAVAYVDPGNVAANVTAGSRYGFMLTWVLVLASAMAVLVQYQSARLGIVTGQSIPELLAKRLGTTGRRLYWLQAEVVAAATDLAEVIGGAIALQLLFGLPLVWGGVIVGIASMALLALKDHRGQRAFENTIIVFLGVIALGFLSALFLQPPSLSDVAGGLVPRFQGTDSVLVASSMLGATVMPHAIYLHSSLVGDRHGAAVSDSRIKQLLKASKLDVVGALIFAGMVNVGLLLLAAHALRGVPGTDTIEGAHSAVSSAFGPVIGTLFAVGLLASGLASTSVGAYAGSEIMRGLLHVQLNLYVRRLLTIIPALVILALNAEPTWALVISQVVLSFGIPFAVIPLMVLTQRSSVMGKWRNGYLLGAATLITCALIVGLNILLLTLMIIG